MSPGARSQHCPWSQIHFHEHVIVPGVSKGTPSQRKFLPQGCTQWPTHGKSCARFFVPSVPLRGIDDSAAAPSPSDTVVAPPAFRINLCDESIVSELLPAVPISPKRGDSTEGRTAHQPIVIAHASGTSRPQSQYKDTYRACQSLSAGRKVPTPIMEHIL